MLLLHFNYVLYDHQGVEYENIANSEHKHTSHPIRESEQDSVNNQNKKDTYLLDCWTFLMMRRLSRFHAWHGV